MVRRVVAEEPQGPVERVTPKRNWEAEHAEYWSEEQVAMRAKFDRDSGGLHIQDGFRIICDGIVDGAECGNVIGMATFQEDHDCLCDRCRHRRLPFPPRIHLTPERVIYDHWELDRWRERQASIEMELHPLKGASD